ncbi:SusC/RagA family TonB-linked outer membrane protein [Lacibacter luteus]|uniref:SusC/RagA family TonB-linked outer membrane protein n=1 Tax=Lacibacter luteus TaxID=2508719 RepID=A0A4Q1CFV3_9BACT|nr:SusC/RagA family TonB-linked outer membrane protein [Lacibacter luteus]RXK58849.1 SusC/RagA family TonB-linked outer membrane protein [Lacibacter luteus]
MKQLIYCLALLCPLLSNCQQITIKGNVINEEGNPVSAATIILKGTTISTVANAKGEFTLPNTKLNDSIIVSAIGYQTAVEPNNMRGLITVILKRKVTQLDETVIIAYGTSTKRFNTGNVATITTAQLATQPLLNPLAALHGRVPGLVVTQSSGAPGAAIKIEIRGRTSLESSASGNDPLFIIDGIPFSPGNEVVSQLRSSANNPRSASQGGLSPFALINPADIERIDILKDADATAIYGSRGANGVVLITTKQAKPGRTLFTVNAYTGISRIATKAELLNTQQYLQMRREAFANDGIAPTIANAPDLLLWDTSRYRNFVNDFIGNSASNSNIQLSLSGGNSNTRFLLGTGFNRETAVFPGSFAASRASANIKLTHNAPSQKLSLTFTASYAAAVNNSIKTDLSTYINLPPNFPALYDAQGNLKWSEGGVSFANPLAEQLRSYKAINENLNTGLLLSLVLTKALSFKLNTGYNLFRSNERSLHPAASLDPASSSLPFSNFAGNRMGGFIIEPQLEYQRKWKQLRFTGLLGATAQQNAAETESVNGLNYSSDLLLASMAAAPLLIGSNSENRYRYTALFTRLTMQLNNRYLLNLSARRDGSSRFGPGNRFGNFGAIGFGWIFSKEKFLQNQSILSFGKWRSSYGITGSDQVGDYRYLDTWQNTALTYLNANGLQPSRLFNPNYGWEVNKKFETALELGFFNDQLFFSVAWFQNRSGNRLVNYSLPAITGFSSVLRNWDALVQNTGWEFLFTSQNIQTAKISWSTTVNMTLPQNKLLAFPGLDASPYRNNYRVGQSLSVIYGFRYLGVDPATGIYSYQDLDSNGLLNTSDYQLLGNTDPVFYGGVGNSVSIGQFRFSCFVEFRKQQGRNYLATQAATIPGRGMFNQPLLVLDRWQKPGDIATIQRYTTTTNSTAYIAAVTQLAASNAIFSDASFIRLKNLACSWSLPQAIAAKMKLQALSIQLSAQNLFSITRYAGADPENQNFFVLPPLRTVTGGIQFSF